MRMSEIRFYHEREEETGSRKKMPNIVEIIEIQNQTFVIHGP